MIIDNVFSLNEIKILQQCCDAQPIKSIVNNPPDGYIFSSGPDLYVYNKEIMYQHNMSPFRKIIKPKIDNIVGLDHVVDTSAYREYNVSYSLHIDSRGWQSQMGDYQFSTGEEIHNKAILIPLVEGEEFTTTVFDIHTDIQIELDKPLPTEWLTSSNNLDLKKYQHLPEQHLQDLNKLPLIDEFKWKLGSVLVFDRCLLHCSTHYSHISNVKKLIVLFLA